MIYLMTETSTPSIPRNDICKCLIVKLHALEGISLCNKLLGNGLIEVVRTCGQTPLPNISVFVCHIYDFVS